MPLVQTRGAASAQGFGEFSQSGPVNYIEDMFSAFLWTGTGGQAGPFVTGVDLLNKGGLLWTKSRSNAYDHYLMDTVRGNGSILTTNNTAAAVSSPNCVNFYADGFKDNFSYGGGTTQVSWTFRKQPKFFDVVTYTGNGVLSYEVPHNLGSVPGCIIWKRTDSTSNWGVWHIASGITTSKTGGSLNSTNAFLYTLNATPYQSATTFQPAWVNDAAGNNGNINGATYVAYLFASNAGGFGLTGTDNVISCGSVVGSSQVEVNLGYEPQWILVKNASAAQDWWVVDSMRGLPVQDTGGAYNASNLRPNLSDAETTGFSIAPSATGFKANVLTSGQTYIYIAIRRGPMKVPTTGTSVFAPVTGNFSSPYTVTTNFPVDLTISSSVTGSTRAVNDRLRGGTTTSYNYLNTTTTAAESTGTGAGLGFQNNTAVIDNNWQTGSNAFWWNFRRAPSFMDVVCYTGNGSTQTIAHNLGVVPELILGKNRTTAGNNFPATFNFTSTNSSYAFINLTSAGGNDIYANVGVMTAQPTSTNIYLSASGSMNTSGAGQVAYLFATCAGVSKVGSYTGTGATQTIDCGFGAGGARFVLIKRTDSTGDWWVWDSARGMVSGTDPRIDLNVGNPQTNANWVYTISTGFQIVTTDASVNANGGTYIFLAIA